MLGSFHLGIFDAERAYMTGPVQKDFDCRLFAQIVRLNMEGIWLSVWMARTAKENARGSSSRSNRSSLRRNLTPSHNRWYRPNYEKHRRCKRTSPPRRVGNHQCGSG